MRKAVVTFVLLLSYSWVIGQMDIGRFTLCIDSTKHGIWIDSTKNGKGVKISKWEMLPSYQSFDSVTIDNERKAILILTKSAKKWRSYSIKKVSQPIGRLEGKIIFYDINDQGGQKLQITYDIQDSVHPSIYMCNEKECWIYYLKPGY
jgi:hypothetical protein